MLCPSSFESVKINIAQLDCCKQYNLHIRCNDMTLHGTAQAWKFPKALLFSKDTFTKKSYLK